MTTRKSKPNKGTNQSSASRIGQPAPAAVDTDAGAAEAEFDAANTNANTANAEIDAVGTDTATGNTESDAVGTNVATGNAETNAAETNADVGNAEANAIDKAHSEYNERIINDLFGDDTDKDENDGQETPNRIDDSTYVALRTDNQVMGSNSTSDLLLSPIPKKARRSDLENNLKDGKNSKTPTDGVDESTDRIQQTSDLGNIQLDGKKSKTSSVILKETRRDDLEKNQSSGKKSKTSTEGVDESTGSIQQTADLGNIPLDGKKSKTSSVVLKETGRDDLEKNQSDGKKSKTSADGAVDADGVIEQTIDLGVVGVNSETTSVVLDRVRGITNTNETSDSASDSSESGEEEGTQEDNNGETQTGGTDVTARVLQRKKSSNDHDSYYEGNKTFEDVTEDFVLQMPLVQLVTFLHSDETTVLAQPAVNHRALSIMNISGEEFQKRMQLKGNDFGEEMHALVYEVRQKSHTAPVGSEAVPIFSTYATTSQTAMGHQLAKVEAIYPTLDGLRQLQKTFSMRSPIKNNSPKTIAGIFERIINQHDKSDPLTTITPPPNEKLGNRLPNTTQMQLKWKSLNDAAKRQPIRLAIIGGLQRCGLAAHMLGNKIIHNSIPKAALCNTYNFKSDSSLKAIIPLHLMFPVIQSYDPLFIEQCASYSKIVTLRKYEALQTTIKAQLFDIIACPGNPAKAAEINEKRKITKSYWLDREVRMTCFWK